MDEIKVFDNFQAVAQSLPDSDRKTLFTKLIDVLQAKIASLDTGWEQMNFYDDAGNFCKEQVFMGLLERGTKKRTYQEMIDIYEHFIHPEDQGLGAGD